MLSILTWCKARGAWGLPYGVLLVACFWWAGHIMGPLRSISRHWPHCCCPRFPPQFQPHKGPVVLDKAGSPEAENPWGVGASEL